MKTNFVASCWPAAFLWHQGAWGQDNDNDSDAVEVKIRVAVATSR